MATKTAPKFDVKTEAARVFYAGVGVNDLVVEVARNYVAGFQKQAEATNKDVQKFVSSIDVTPKGLRSQAEALVDVVAKDAAARRAAVEARVAELLEVPTKVQKELEKNAEAASAVYADLAKRGEDLVARIRNQKSTEEAVKASKTAVAKAKTTRTQATKAAEAEVTEVKKTAKKAADKATTTVRKAAAKKPAAKKAPARKTAAQKKAETAVSSAKATVTAAEKAVEKTAAAVVDAAAKIGD